MIIAEVGQNHCGNIGLAKHLICEAKRCGGDLVKFQLYDHQKLYKDCPEVPNVELSFDQAKMLFDYGREIGIEVFFSVFDVERVKWCEEIGVKRYKIPCRKSPAVVDAVFATGKPIIISYDNLPASDKIGRNKFLYCVSEYPAEVKNFGLIKFSPDSYDGFSDHTIGLDVAKIALARGAEIIEKHFAIDHKTGIDAVWSMTPSELKELKEFERVVQETL